MALQPLEDRIVVKPGDAEETTASGLVIPDTAKEKPQQGEVLAIGPGKRSEQTGEIIPLDIGVGDTVVYSILASEWPTVRHGLLERLRAVHQ